MANTQINITENGTKTLATAGKYCDRNIDVNVAVPGEPTQFTNLYDPANVTVKTVMAASSSSGVTYNTDNYCNVIKIPYHHKAGDPFVLRLRGIGTVRDRNSSVLFEEDATTRVNHYTFTTSSSYFDLHYDEYGDATITFTGAILNYEWHYFGFNFQYPGINSGATAITGPIVTVNEPIGNGGYAA